MVLAKEHTVVTGPRSGSSVSALSQTTLGCLGQSATTNQASIKPTGPLAIQACVSSLDATLAGSILSLAPLRDPGALSWCYLRLGPLPEEEKLLVSLTSPGSAMERKLRDLDLGLLSP
jgi:hypothetical protein